ncbi:hypothetical protein BH09MYX1_BH09MYX1_15500 [soil metagenome]
MFCVRRACAILAFGAAILAATNTGAQGSVDFDTCRNAYLTKDYKEAEARFEAMAKVLEAAPKRPAQLLDVWMYLGAAKLGRALRVDAGDRLENEERAKKKEDAGKLFERVILEDPEYYPDPTSFPTYVLDAYTDIKRGLKDKLNQIAIAAAKERARQEQVERDLKAQREVYVKLLEEQAAREEVTAHHTRWLALLPFGVGQYQNGKPVLGTIFLGLEASCIIGTGITFAMYRLDISRGADALVGNEGTLRDRLGLYQQYSDRASVIRLVNLSLIGATALFMAIGIVESQIDYVPDTTTNRARPLPKMPPLPQRTSWITPTIAPMVSEGRDGTLGVGAQIGLFGRF